MQTPMTIPMMIESLRRLVRIMDTMLLMPGIVSTAIKNYAVKLKRELTNDMPHSTVYTSQRASLTAEL
jgi:hypothetical protein